MDSKGYIPISLLASFNRIKQLTLDARLVREVLLLSAFVEVRGGMVRMGGVGTAGLGAGGQGGGGGQGGNEVPGEQSLIQSQNQGGWEAFVLPDAVESVVEDVESVENGGYGYLNGYGYGSGYDYGYGPGYGYGYGYGYPPGPGLGYYEDPQTQHHHQQQQQGAYEQGGVNGGIDEHGHTSAHDQQQHGKALLSMTNGHGSGESMNHKLDDPTTTAPTSTKENEDNKPNGILKHDEGGLQREEEEEAEYEEEEEEDVVFVMGTDVSTSWPPERGRRA